MKTRLLIVILILFLAVYPSCMDFAEFLFSEGDYFRAVTELKRELYENPSSDSVKIFNLIASCHIMTGDLDKAAEYSSRFASNDSDSRFNYLLSRFLCRDFASIDSTSAEGDSLSMTIKHLSLIFQGKFPSEDTLLLGAEEMEIYLGYSGIKKKNPYLALFLSALLPGAGRFYAERSGDGIFSLMTVLTPAAAAAYYYFYTDFKPGLYASAGAFAAFYAGELYGAYNSASIYHKNKTEEYYKKVLLDYSASLLSPKFSF